MKDSHPTSRSHLSALRFRSCRKNPSKLLRLDFVARREFDYTVTEFASGKKRKISSGSPTGATGRRFTTRPSAPDRPRLTAVCGGHLPRDLDITRYNVPFLRHPFLAFYTSAGCPAFCTYCLWPQTFGSHKWRTRSSQNVVAELNGPSNFSPRSGKYFR